MDTAYTGYPDFFVAPSIGVVASSALARPSICLLVLRLVVLVLFAVYRFVGAVHCMKLHAIEGQDQYRAAKFQD